MIIFFNFIGQFLKRANLIQNNEELSTFYIGFVICTKILFNSPAVLFAMCFLVLSKIVGPRK